MRLIFTESIIEQAVLAWLESTGWPVGRRVPIANGAPDANRFIGGVC